MLSLPAQGFSGSSAGEQFDQSGFGAAGSVGYRGAVFPSGEGKDHEGTGDQRHDGEAQTGARREGRHHQLGEIMSHGVSQRGLAFTK